MSRHSKRKARTKALAEVKSTSWIGFEAIMYSRETNYSSTLGFSFTGSNADRVKASLENATDEQEYLKTLFYNSFGLEAIAVRRRSEIESANFTNLEDIPKLAGVNHQ